MEATKNITAKEREFIAAVEAHRNAEGKVIAWHICANGNGKVIFENGTKDRYSCACVVMMSDGSTYLHFEGSLSHPYDRKTYKRKRNALKGFKMQEGHNEPPTFAATPTETPQISTETAETANVSAEGVGSEKREENERIMRYAGIALTDCKNKQYVGEVELPNGLTLKFKYVYNLNGKDMYTVEDRQNGKLHCSVSHESRERILDYIADIIAPAEPPQPPETPQMAECTAEPLKLAQTA